MACSTCASAKWPMRHLAMTGMDTASMMPSIMSGSLIRATPPCTRMSAGTRSSAMTATAPASSAILAWSGVTTSMITPPLSISAMPRFTRAVPVSFGAGTTFSLATVRTSWCGRVCLHPMRVARADPAAVRGGSDGLVAVRSGVVHLEEPRLRRVSREAEHPRQRPPPVDHGPGGYVVVELAGDKHLAGRRLHLGHELAAPLVLELLAEAGLAERGAKRAGQVAFRQVALAGAGLLGPAHGIGDQQAGCRIEQPGGGQLVGDRAAPLQRQVQRGARGLDPVVHPVEPASAP